MGMPAVVGVSVNNQGTGAITIAFPVGYTAIDNDIALTFRECDNGGTITAPSGWAIAANQGVASGATTRISIIWKRLVAGDTAPSIAFPVGGDHHTGRMIIISGCKTTGFPWNQVLTGQELLADTTVSITGVTTTAADCLCLYAFSTGQDIASTAGATGWANASLGSVTERMDNWVSTATGGGLAMASGTKATAGATGNMAATLSLAANFKAQVCIALEGAATVPSRGRPTRTPLFGASGPAGRVVYP
jgi:hypothetical protein